MKVNVDINGHYDIWASCRQYLWKASFTLKTSVNKPRLEPPSLWLENQKPIQMVFSLLRYFRNMKRGCVNTRVGGAKKLEVEEEKLGKSLLTNPMSNRLIKLPPELVVMVASNLDLIDYMNLAISSETTMHILLSQYHLRVLWWKPLLQKIKMKDDERFEARLWPRFERPKLPARFEARFETLERPRLPGPVYNTLPSAIRKTHDTFGFWHQSLKFQREHIAWMVQMLATSLNAVQMFSRSDPDESLILALLHTISESFPADLGSEFKHMASVSCPCSANHQVTSFGFALLEQAETLVGGADAEPKQKLVAYKGFGVEHLEAFASRALRQKQKLDKIEIYFMSNFHGWIDENKVWLQVIQNCASWKIEYLYSSEDDSEKVTDLLEGLAREAARGAIGTMTISDLCIAESKVAELERLWEITEAGWEVQGAEDGAGKLCVWACQDEMWEGLENDIPRFWIGKDQGWAAMLPVINDIQARKHAWHEF